MRAESRQFLAIAIEALQLDGPVVLLASQADARPGPAGVRELLAGQGIVHVSPAASEPNCPATTLRALPLAADRAATFVAIDVVQRFDAAADLVEVMLRCLAPGGVGLLTADVAGVRPQAGLSRVLTPLGLERLLAPLDGALIGWQGENDFPHTLFAVVCKSPLRANFAGQAGRIIQRCGHAHSVVAAQPAWRRKLARLVPWQGRISGAAPLAAPCFSLHLPPARDWREAFCDGPPAEENPGSRIDLC